MKSERRKYIVLTWMVIFASLLLGKELDNGTVDKLSKPNAANGPSQTVVNINNWAYWITKTTAYTLSGSANGAQADYPKGTGAVIYGDGMLWGAKVYDGGPQEVRVNGTTHATGLKAGRAVFDNAGNIIGSTNPADHHAWRVRKDYKTADLTGDASNYFQVMAPNVANAGQISEVYDQYEYDWNNWPVTWGAPYNDIDGNGAYDPTIDIPGYPGADQTVYVIANDIPQIVHENGDPFLGTDGEPLVINTSPNAYGSDPIGIELQVTLWGYNYGGGDPLGNIIFKKAKILYTGLPGGPIDARMEDVYFTLFSDPDLGTYTDDYVGCDVELSLGYVYNGNKKDNIYQSIYNLPVPAAGYDFLQGPTVDGEVLGMTSFTYFGAGSAIGDPLISSYTEGTLEYYNLMEGFLPSPAYPIQKPWTDLSTGEITKFVLSGDPIGGGGWTDGVQLPPGDRRLVMASGPFNMVLGDEQEVVFGIIGGMGTNNITSLGVVMYYDLAAQYAYDLDFDIPVPPSAPQIVGFGQDKTISLDWGSNAAAIDATELPVSKGFEFEGYSLYQLPSLNSPLTSGVKLETWDIINEVATIFDKGVDPTTGYVIDLPKQPGRNTGLAYFWETDYDELRGRPMSNGVVYYYALTAYSFKPDANEDDPFITIESSPARIAVTPHSVNPGTSVPVDFGGLIDVIHTGTGGGIGADITVVNTDELTEDDYLIFFDQQHYYVDVDGVWKYAASANSVDKKLGKVRDCSGSTITGTAVTSAVVGTMDLIFTFDMDCGSNWVDGLVIDLPDNIMVNEWDPVAGCDYGTDQGQNCENMFGTLDEATSTITWGNDLRSTFGAIQGSQTLTVNVNSSALPITFDFIVYDDVYDGTLVDATGTVDITEIAYAFKTIKYWNAMNVTTGEIFLEDQWALNGIAEEHITDGFYYPRTGVNYIGDDFPTVDGFRIEEVTGSYAAPADFSSLTSNGAGVDVGFNQGAAETDYNVDSYFASGWGPADAVGSYGSGLTSVDDLQRDVKMVFDGELGDPITTSTGASYYPVVEGGSQVWIFQGNTLATHPANPNPGSGDPFLLDVPFKVFDVEDPENPIQISLIMRDRIQTYDGSDTELYAFNPDDRVYTWFVKRPYEETLNDFASNEAFLSWNIVWWRQQWTTGDELTFVYPNPVQLGVDEISWTTEGFSTGGEITQDDIDMIQVAPNPYYGFQETEISRSNKFVSFNHLPEKATIRIFTIAGTMVAQIDKNDATQFARWDLANQYGYPVASGVYIIHVETEYGEKILKLALVQETQVLKYY